MAKKKTKTGLIIKPETLRWRTWEPYTPTPWPEEREFDPETHAELFYHLVKEDLHDMKLKGFKETIRGHGYYYSTSNEISRMSLDEAKMWLEVSKGNYQDEELRQLETLQSIAESTSSIEVEYQYFIQALLPVKGRPSLLDFDRSSLLMAAYKLLPIEEYVYFLCGAALPVLTSHPEPKYPKYMAAVFRDGVWPFLSEDDLVKMRSVFIDYVKGPAFTNPGKYPQQMVLLASYLGLEEMINDYVANLKPEQLYQIYNLGSASEMIDPILSFKDTDRIKNELNRLDLPLYEQYHLDAWITKTGTEHLGVIGKSIARIGRKDLAGQVFRYFTKIASVPEAVPAVLHCYAHSKVSAKAREWISKHSDWAIPSLKQIVREKGDCWEQANQLLQVIDPDSRATQGQLEKYELTDLKASTEKEISFKLSGPILPGTAEKMARNFPPEAQAWVTYSPNRFRRKMPKARPFDLDKSKKYVLTWSQYETDLECSADCGEEESLFIVHTILALSKAHMKRRSIHFKEVDFRQVPSLEEVVKAINYRGLWGNKHLLPILLKVYKQPEVIISFILHDMDRWSRDIFLLTLRYDFIPLLNDKQYNSCKTAISEYFEKTSTTSETSKLIAAAFGTHDICLQICSDFMKEKRYHYNASEFYLEETVLFGLGSTEDIEKHLKKLQPSLLNEHYINALYAHFGTEAPRLLESTLKTPMEQGLIDNLFRYQLDKFSCPSMAELLFHYYDKQYLMKHIRDWMERHPDETIAALLYLASKATKDRLPAQQLLRKISKLGKKERILELAGLHGNEFQDWVEETISVDYKSLIDNHQGPAAPQWFDQAVAGIVNAPRFSLPLFVVPELLPPLAMGKRCLNETHIKGVLGALAVSTLQKPHPLVTMIKECTKPADRSAFAWGIFEQWMQEGAPSKDKWGLLALGHFGDDDCAIKLAPMIKRWPGEAQHARAVNGLECLRAIGTDTALMQVNGIAQRVKFKGIKTTALEAMESIAFELGLTREELEDRIVPDCGLDENGTCLFDFGPRSFTFALSPDFKPVLRDSSGAIKKDLPKPGQKDDTEKAEAAVASWKLLKKTIREAIKIQVPRLEQIMVTGRTWSLKEFQAFIVQQPLMINFAKLILWSAYNEKGIREQTFRVSEDRTFADLEDNELSILPNSFIGITHPLDISDSERNTWKEVFADYELLPPFPQLDRPTFVFNTPESTYSHMTQWNEIPLSPQKFIRPIDNAGWVRSPVGEGGTVECHSKSFHRDQVTAVIHYKDGGFYTGGFEEDDEIAIEEVYFVPICDQKGWDIIHLPRTKIEKISPIVISEVIRDLQTVIKKAKVK